MASVLACAGPINGLISMDWYRRQQGRPLGGLVVYGWQCGIQASDLPLSSLRTQ